MTSLRPTQASQGKGERAKNKNLDDLRKAEAQNVLNAQNKLQAQSDAIMRRAGDAAGAFGKSFAAAAAGVLVALTTEK